MLSKQINSLFVVDKSLLQCVSGGCNCYCATSTFGDVCLCCEHGCQPVYSKSCCGSGLTCQFETIRGSVWVGGHMSNETCAATCMTYVNRTNYMYAGKTDYCGRAITFSLVGSICI